MKAILQGGPADGTRIGPHETASPLAGITHSGGYYQPTGETDNDGWSIYTWTGQ